MREYGAERRGALAGVVRAHGAPNFRDLGGRHTCDGRVVAPGRLFRTSALHRLDARGAAALGDLGPVALIDLRDPAEAAATGPAPTRAVRRVVSHPVGQGAAGDLATPLLERYRQYLAHPAPIVAALGDLAAIAPAPVAVSCFFGKDRTGVVIALALSALGVARAEIVADYAASQRPTARLVAELARDPVYAAALARTPPERLDAPAALLEALLDDLDAGGGVAAWLGDAGLATSDLASLADGLLVAPRPGDLDDPRGHRGDLRPM